MPPPGPSTSETLTDLAFGRCVLRPAARELLVDGRPVPVGARAFDLLLALVERRERMVTKDELLDQVWPGVIVEENNLQVHVSALRRLLGPAAIATVKGRGYRFAADVRAAPAGRVGDAPAGGLPAESLTALFGRAHDLQTLHYLSLAHRLVNIVGAAGIGKTALARAVATQQAGRFTYGTRFVDLAPLARADELAPCLAAALQPWRDAREDAADPASAFSLLLVLDPCEHLVHAVAEWAAAALARWPGLHLLATSHEPLRLPAEQVYRVTALALPSGPGLARALEASAVRLFEARARAADPGFVLDADNAERVAAICRQLDGMALAIELAAARVPLLGLQGLQGLHDRLQQRPHGLDAAAPEDASRQRAPASALDGRHAQLSPMEQTVLRRLAVMSGSFDPAGAQAVAGGDGLDPRAVLEPLGSLVDKSLVGVADDGPEAVAGGVTEPRLRLLETVRQFALERLAEAGENAACRNRHLTHLRGLAEQARGALNGPAAGLWLSRLDRDRDNLFAALAWCDHAPDGAAQGLRMVVALHRYWLHRGSLVQAALACDAALARPGAEAQGALYGQALWVAGQIDADLGRDAVALARLQRCADLAGGDPALRVRARVALGTACARQGLLAAAREQQQDAMTAARLAPECPERLLAAAYGLAELARREGRLDEAQPLCDEALRRARALGDRPATLSVLASLCLLALARQPVGVRAAGPPASEPALRLVAQRLREALTIADELGSARGHRTVLAVGAAMADAQGAWARALRWHAAAAPHPAAPGWPLDAPDIAALEALPDRARSALGAAPDAGARMSAAEALVELRELLSMDAVA